MFNLALSISFRASKMANYASIPKHPPTTNLWHYSSGITSNIVKIGVWNVNGIRSVLNKGTLENYLKESSVDVLCINETKMDLSAYMKDNVKGLGDCWKKEGYEEYWNFCKVSAGYSGVLTLSKFKPIRAIEDFPLPHHFYLEGRCLTLEYEAFYLVNCYIPNSGSNLDRLKEKTEIYMSHFIQFIESLKQTKKVIICGDMNVAHQEIDLANPKQNKNTAGFTIDERQSFSRLLNECKLTDAWRYLHPNKIEYTWWSNRTGAREKGIGWRIDYILMSMDEKKILKKAEIKSNVMGSDHCPVECVIDLGKKEII